jgi:hypothetical protein
VAYTLFSYLEQPTVLLQDRIVMKKYTLDKGTRLLAFRAGDDRQYCSFLGEVKSFGMNVSQWSCLAPSPRSETFVSASLVVHGYPPALWKTLKPPFPKYEQSAAIPIDLDIDDLQGEHLFRKEVVYQGAAGGVLRLLYREFVNDLARPAFSQELTYDIPDGGPLTVFVKGLKMTVHSAGNEGMAYTIEQGLEPFE